MSYLIWAKLRDYVETPINVLVFICTNWTEVNALNLRKFILLLMFQSSLIHIPEGKKHSHRADLVCL